MNSTKPKELKILEALEHRSPLTPYQKQQLEKLKFHFQLESQFAVYLNDIHPDHIIWHFTYYDNHHESMVNTIVFTNNAVHLFKLNYYGGLHYINETGMLCDYFTDEVKMDVVQLNCIKYSIHQLIPINCPIHIHAVCLNETFELDCKSNQQPFLLRKHIDHFIKKELLRNPPQKKTDHLKQVITKLRFHTIFHFNQLQPGLRCPHCHQINQLSFHSHLARCNNCRQIHNIDDLLANAVIEYRLLYPDSPLSKSRLFDWCAEKIPKHKIASYLKSNFQSEGKTKGRIYLELNIP